MSWDQVRIGLAEGLAWLRSREVSTNAAGMTIDQAILEAIVEIDSEEGASEVATLRASKVIDVNDDAAVRPGLLQRLKVLEDSFLGYTTTDDAGNPVVVKGILELAQELEDPNLTGNPEE